MVLLLATSATIKEVNSPLGFVSVPTPWFSLMRWTRLTLMSLLCSCNSLMR